MSIQTDTIAAISTPPGAGAIGILRLSGPLAITIAEQCFKPLGSKGLREHEPRRLVYGDLLDSGGQAIDRVLCTYSLGPSSYTGEDTAEFQCHGSPTVLTLGLEALFAAGARQAGAGEFTRRAFLNGRLDLAQAEAVGDLLEAQSREGARHAAGQLAGALSKKIGDIYSALVDVMAHFHAVLDYPDEDIDPFRMEELSRTLEEQTDRLWKLYSSGHRGSLLTQGLKCPIVGRPNAGKSSLLNALAGYDRAIVTDIPGTTRDTVEVSVQIKGVLVRLIDTAGIRESDDPIERIGVARSREALEGSNLIVMVCDGAAPFTQEDAGLLEACLNRADTVLVWNKSDLPSAPVPVLSLPEELGEHLHTASVSSKTGAGLEELEETMRTLMEEFFPRVREEAYGQLLTNERQIQAAEAAHHSVYRALKALQAGVTPDALLTDVEEALSALGELTGQSVREDVTDRIFQRFCVGK
ncbi:tRNA uridine-5-carboxymethylaminomethyl(34) synthesis GTPase MnmE [Flintibacter muris]|uniref:tRNA uridine-5-carboxymethylaminomethyl(34) synthesis GTPase MnmE n=1 Tax=Flintibacter muris TaxID=2941327 RepID=UPI00203E159A|nr:tRNA uridine-5-carboxymethylaminomethyl(34) synthesis GTPase MnmE [Flintibacter muris]